MPTSGAVLVRELARLLGGEWGCWYSAGPGLGFFWLGSRARDTMLGPLRRPVPSVRTPEGPTPTPPVLPKSESERHRVGPLEL